MNPLHDDQRISGYLDGELSADEQTRFEERLAESAELRQLVEELRALRGSLDLLPRHRLDNEFADRVLRRAEREMLAAGESQTKGESQTNTGDSTTPSVGTSQSQPANPSAAKPAGQASRAIGGSKEWKRRAVRPLIYVALAIAAAVLIMVMNPNRPKEREVAQVTDEKKQNAPPSGGSTVQASDTTGDGKNSENHVLKRLAKTAGEQDGDKSRADLYAKKDGEAGPAMAGRNMAPARPNGEQALSESGKSTAAQPKFGAIAGNPDATTNSTQAKEKLPASAPAAPGQAGFAKGGAGSTPALQSFGDNVALRKDGLRSNVAATRGMVVAECFAAPEVAEPTFNRLLAKNGIAWSQLGDEAPAPAAMTERFQQRAGEKDVKLEVRDRLADQLGRSDPAKRSGGEAAQEKDFEVVYVEGTPEQVQALVSDVKAEPAVFRSLTVATALSKSVAPFSYRGEVPAADEAGAAELRAEASRDKKPLADARPEAGQPTLDAESHHTSADQKGIKADDHGKSREPAAKIAADKMERDERLHDTNAPAGAAKLPQPPQAHERQTAEGLDAASKDRPASESPPAGDKESAGIRRATPPELKKPPRDEPATPAPAAAPIEAALGGAAQGGAAQGEAAQGGAAAGKPAEAKATDAKTADAIAAGGRGAKDTTPEHTAANGGFAGDRPTPAGAAAGVNPSGSAAPADRPLLAANKPGATGGGRQPDASDHAKAKSEPLPIAGYALRLATIPAAAEPAAQQSPPLEKWELPKAGDAPIDLEIVHKQFDDRGPAGALPTEVPAAANGALSSPAGPLPAATAPQSNSRFFSRGVPAAKSAADGIAPPPPERMQAIFVFRRAPPVAAPPAALPAAEPPTAPPPAAKDKK